MDNIWKEKYTEEAQREYEESTSLGSLLASPKEARVRTEASSEEILLSGALPEVHKKKQSAFSKTKYARMRAYMEVDRKSIAETKGWRIRAAYRMVTYMARIMGDLTGPTTLDSLFSRVVDPSITPFTKPASIRTNVFGTKQIQRWFMAQEEMTYLPNPDDRSLEYWCEAYERLSSFLKIEQGTMEEPEAGVFGTIGMFNTETARMLWPLRDEILLYEQELLLMVFDALCERSGQAVEQMIMTKLGYSRPEAVMLVKTALQYGTAVYAEDFNMNKIKELKALEVISDKSVDAQDPRAALAARKQLHLVSGLTKSKEAEGLEDFRELAAKALEGDDDPLLLEG